MGKPIEQRELTGRVIGAAISLHKALGPGYLEAVYEEAFCVELKCENIAFERQRIVPISYRGQHVGEHRLDLLVEGSLIVELKAVQELQNIHFSIVRSYMKALGLNDALLFNFAAAPLVIKRVGRERNEIDPEFLISRFPAFQ
jgi:GxxExxY protein